MESEYIWGNWEILTWPSLKITCKELEIINETPVCKDFYSATQIGRNNTRGISTNCKIQIYSHIQGCSEMQVSL